MPHTPEPRFSVHPTVPFSLVSEELGEVEALIARQLKQTEPHLKPAAAIIRHGSGKRLRPTVFFLFLKLLGKTPSLPHIVTGTVLELCHTASLLHDDVLDNAEYRRGMTALNKKRGNREAILFGDHILARAFKLLSELSQPGFVSILSELVETVCSGEILQWQLRGSETTEENYFKTVRMKTASFFRTSGVLASEICHLDSTRAELLGVWGETFGVAFQVYDDLYDLVSPPRADKSTGRDAESGILTLPWIKLRTLHGSRTMHKLYLQARTANDSDGHKQLLADKKLAQAVAETVFTAKQLLERGRKAITAFPAGSARNALENCSDYLLGRITEVAGASGAQRP